MSGTIVNTVLIFATVHSIPAFAFDFEIDKKTEFSVFGEFQYIYVVDEERLLDPDESLDETPPQTSLDDDSETVSELMDNGSKIGFSGRHTFDNDLSAYFSVEWGYTADEDTGGLDNTGDAYIGLEGEFGKFQLGNWDSIYSEAISDVLDEFEYEGTSAFDHDENEGDRLAYFSPDFSGFSFEIQTALKGKGEGIDNDGDLEADQINPIILVGKYSNDLFAIYLGYDDRALLHADAEPQIGLAGILNLEPFSIGAKFETIGDTNDLTADSFEAYGLIGSFDYEVGVVTTAFQQISYKNEVNKLREDRSEFIIGANYNLSENLYFYIESATYDLYLDQADYMAVGTVLSF